MVAQAESAHATGVLGTLYHVTDEEERRVREAEQIRVERLRADARRSMSENLREGIALSHKLLAFTGAARVEP